MIPNSKVYIAKHFPDVSKTVIKCIDDEWQIVGKFGSITPFDDGRWDMYMAGSTNRINKLLAHHEKRRLKAPFHAGNGEGWATVLPEELNLINHRLLGVRQKRKISPKERERLSQQMKLMHLKSKENTNA